MATVSTLLLATALTPIVDVSMYNLNVRPALTNGIANNGDSIQVVTIQRNGRLVSSHVKALATLGAGATVKLQLNRAGSKSDLTVATTAGGASYVNSATIGPVDVQAGDIIELLVGGANITAASSVEIDLALQH